MRQVNLKSLLYLGVAISFVFFSTFLIPRQIQAAVPMTFCAGTLTDAPLPSMFTCPCTATCDQPDCTLRAAIQCANDNAANDTINLIAGTYTLTANGYDDDNKAGDLDLTDRDFLTFILGQGAGQTIIDASGLSAMPDRVFEIVQTALGATFTGMTIQGGHAQDPALSKNTYAGGGILCLGSVGMGMDDVVVQDNSVVAPTGADVALGGGVFIFQSTAALIKNSIIQRNSATAPAATSSNVSFGSAGGLAFDGDFFLMTDTSVNDNSALPGFAGGVLAGSARIFGIGNSAIYNNRITSKSSSIPIIGWGAGVSIVSQNPSNYYLISNSTISDNHTDSNGGGLFVGITGITNPKSFLILSSDTIFNNQAGTGGGVFVFANQVSDTVALQNTIIAGNSADTDPDCSGGLDSFGYNLIQDDSAGCNIDANNGGTLTGNIIGEDPMLDILAFNGGLTPTHALRQGSKALDAANPDGCFLTAVAFAPTPSPIPFDQRDDPFLRILAGVPGGTPRCDIGAYEANTPDLQIVKTASATEVLEGDSLTYTITATNNGPGTSTGVQVTDTLPPQVSFVSAAASQGACTEASGTVTCDLGSLLEGDSATITIEVTITNFGSITNTAVGTEDENDPDLANNTSTVTVMGGGIFLEGSGCRPFSLNYNPTMSYTVMFLFLLFLAPAYLGWKRYFS